MLAESARGDQAIQAYRNALRAKPELGTARLRLLQLLGNTGRIGEVGDTALAGIQVTPGEGEWWRFLEHALDALLEQGEKERAFGLLDSRIVALADQTAGTGFEFRRGALKRYFQGFLADELDRHAGDLKESLLTLARPAFANAELSLPKIEAHLTYLRRKALLSTADLANGSASELPVPGLAALAETHFLHEYVAYVSSEESALLNALTDRLTNEQTIDCADEAGLALIACYRSLSEIPAATWKRVPDPSASLRRLLRCQIDEPAFERSIAGTIPTITSISDAVSIAVGRMYEENPYPRWKTLPAINIQKTSFAEYLENMLPALRAPHALRQDIFDVLVAGCGTGHQPILIAKSLEMARILAVDLSLASLSYAKRKAMELGCRNIEFARADLLELATTSRRFPYIESGGVLHHLASPGKGLRVLADLLEPGGIIHFSVYSQRAREHFGVLAAQQHAARNGYHANADDIRRFRKELFSGEHSSDFARIVKIQDFFSLSECRDLLFHVMEHRFTPGGLGELCASAGLRFAGFVEPLPGVFSRYSRRFPDDPERLLLANWEQYEIEEPGTFIWMYRIYAQKAF